jgi:hypothetical protein
LCLMHARRTINGQRRDFSRKAHSDPTESKSSSVLSTAKLGCHPESTLLFAQALKLRTDGEVCRLRNCKAHGHIAYDHSHHGLFVSHHRCAAAERQERRYCGGFRWHGQPDRLRTARRGHGSVARNYMVGHHLYGDFDHALGFRFAPCWYELGAAGSQSRAGQITTGETRCATSDAASSRTAEISDAGSYRLSAFREKAES